MSLGEVLLIWAVALLTTLVYTQGGKLMAFGAEVLELMQRIAPQIEAATADIHKIHALLEAGTDPDIEAARAAIAEVEAKMAALGEAVAIPEPGDPPPPTP